MIENKNKFPLDFGEKVVILSPVCESFRPMVTYLEWLSNESRWKIELLWENGENTYIYSSDRYKYWMSEKEYLKKNTIILN